MSEWIIGFYAGVAFAAVLMFLELLLMRKVIDLLGEAICIIFGKKEAGGYGRKQPIHQADRQ